MNSKRNNPVIYWNKKVPDTELERFQRFIEEKHDKKFSSYWDFHRWTVQNYTKFWEEIWHYFGVICSNPYDQVFVKTGHGFLDNKWFVGAKLNYAENILRIRDNRIALMYLDELGNEETVTFAMMFEKVKIYAAAFRKNGLRMGDRVAYFMSNRKEAIFALLASASIGAISGGPIPYYGAQAASSIVSMIDPKFLISIDSHQDSGNIFPILDLLPEIVDNAPTLQKVILVATKKETYRKDLSHIRKCVLLEDFLNEGLDPDGKVPEITFEQLSFNHPLCLNFTSGSTGLPKAVIHSAGSFISLMRDFALSDNMKSGDVACSSDPPGWSVWDNFIPCLAMGVKLFLYCGNPRYIIKGLNFWDHIAKFKANMVALTSSIIDDIEKTDIIPAPESDMSCLKEVCIVGSVPKKNNFEYLLTKVNKDVFVANVYSCTELFGTITAVNRNIPLYDGENQIPSLGVDLQCFDSKGNSVVGQRGDVVICTPAVNFLIGLWKDENSTALRDIYLSKYPGVWTQHDEFWINPKTKGFVLLGRSDDTLKQQGNRFGAVDIYLAIHSLYELQDYICVPQTNAKGNSRAVLFVKLKEGLSLTPDLKYKIEKKVFDELWEEFIPEVIVQVPDIPYNLNNKRMESLVRKIIVTNTIPEVANVRNPDSLKHFVNIPEILDYNRTEK